MPARQAHINQRVPLGEVTPQGTEPKAALPPAVSPAAGPALSSKALIEQLTDRDFHQRESASKELKKRVTQLDSSTWEEVREALRTQSNPEAARRLKDIRTYGCDLIFDQVKQNKTPPFQFEFPCAEHHVDSSNGLGRASGRVSVALPEDLLSFLDRHNDRLTLHLDYDRQWDSSHVDFRRHGNWHSETLHRPLRSERSEKDPEASLRFHEATPETNSQPRVGRAVLDYNFNEISTNRYDEGGPIQKFDDTLQRMTLRLDPLDVPQLPANGDAAGPPRPAVTISIRVTKAPQSGK